VNRAIVNQNTPTMNYVTKRNRLKEVLNSYDKFLDFATGVSRIKLMEEILKIDNEVKCINEMTLSKLQQEVDTYFISIPSKINKSTNENQTQIK